jgi:hemolysin III
MFQVEMSGIDVRPLLRGWFHQIAFVLAIPALVVLTATAHTTKGRVAAIVYSLGVCALYGVSSTYHRFRWCEKTHARLQRADHGTIYVMIAATYTPVCLLIVRGALGITLLVTVWIGAATGLTLTIIGRAKRFSMAMYLLLGWLAAIAFPQLITRLQGGQIALLVVGGLLYTVGFAVLATRRPNPFPRIFGYHEVWHTMVIAASVCHWVLIRSVLVAR